MRLMTQAVISRAIPTERRRWSMIGVLTGLASPFVLFYTDGFRHLLPPATWWLFWPTALFGLSSFLREHLALGVLVSVGGNGLLYGLVAVLLRRGCIVLLASLLVAVWLVQPSSDAKLARQFSNHRSQLEMLVQMSDEDTDVVELTPTVVRTKDGVGHSRSEVYGVLPQHRWDEYQNLLREGDFYGFLRSADGQIFVVTSRFDAPDHIRTLLGQASRDTSPNFANAMGQYVGYLYCSSAPKPLTMERPSGYAACNDKQPEFDGESFRYKRLDPDWYLYEVFRKYGG